MTAALTDTRLNELVQEHLNLVYASALRQLQDPHLAADVTQAVFLILQKKLPELDQKVVMAAWLLRVTRYACLDAAKRARRRMYHERKAAAMRTDEAPDGISEAQAAAALAPVIDQTLDRLSRAERELVVLAYYQELPHEEIAARLGIGREAVHKRVQRAVGKLRRMLAQQGVAAGMIGGLTGLNKISAAPPAMVQAVAAGLGGRASAQAQLIAQGTTMMMKVMQMQWRVAAVAVAGVALTAVMLAPAWGQGRGGAAAAPGVPVAASAPAAAPAGTQAGANPLYAFWKAQEGKSVTFNRSEQISGGAPVGGLGPRPGASGTVSYALTQITADQAVISVSRSGNAAVELLTVPAQFKAGDPGTPKAAGTETLKIGDKTYACTKYTYSTTSKAELGRDPQGLSGRVTVWVADGVPGGIVQRHISLLIRVSYDTTETLVPTP